MNAFRLVRTCVAACVLGVLVVACASMGSPAPGFMREQVQSQWGEPLANYALPNGQRLFYKRKPGELQRLDFDATGRMVAMEQVFTAEHFRKLTQGRWEASEVQRSFGPPARRVAAGDTQEDSGFVWMYSWLDFGTWRLARVRIDSAGIVKGVGFVEDPLADSRYR